VAPGEGKKIRSHTGRRKDLTGRTGAFLKVRYRGNHHAQPDPSDGSSTQLSGRFWAIVVSVAPSAINVRTPPLLWPAAFCKTSTRESPAPSGNRNLGKQGVSEHGLPPELHVVAEFLARQIPGRGLVFLCASLILCQVRTLRNRVVCAARRGIAGAPRSHSFRHMGNATTTGFSMPYKQALQDRYLLHGLQYMLTKPGERMGIK
jgi:hypothetical protein